MIIILKTSWSKMTYFWFWKWFGRALKILRACSYICVFAMHCSSVVGVCFLWCCLTFCVLSSHAWVRNYRAYHALLDLRIQRCFPYSVKGFLFFSCLQVLRGLAYLREKHQIMHRGKDVFWSWYMKCLNLFCYIVTMLQK